MEYKYNKSFDDTATAIAEIRRLEALGYEPQVRVWTQLDVDELLEQAVEGIDVEQTESPSESESDTTSDSSDERMDSTRDENESREERSEEPESDTGPDGRRGVEKSYQRMVDVGERQQQVIEFLTSHPHKWVSPRQMVEEMDIEGTDITPARGLAASALKNAVNRGYLPNIEERRQGRNKEYRYVPTETAERDETTDEGEPDGATSELQDAYTEGSDDETFTFRPQTQMHRVLSVMSALAEKQDGVTSPEIHEYVPYSNQQVHNAISHMEEREVIRRTGSTKPYEYYLTPRGHRVMDELGGYQINSGDEQ